MSDITKFKAAVKSVKPEDEVEKDVLHAITALLSKKDTGAASELWGEYISLNTKDQLKKSFKDIDKLFESYRNSNIARKIVESRSTKTGRIDFRTRIGKTSKDYIAKVLNVSDDDSGSSGETDAEVGITDIVSESMGYDLSVSRDSSGWHVHEETGAIVAGPFKFSAAAKKALETIKRLRKEKKDPSWIPDRSKKEFWPTGGYFKEAVAIQKAKKGTKITFWFDKGRVPIELTVNRISGNEVELLDSENEIWTVSKSEFRDRQLKENELTEFNEELNEKIVRSVDSKGKVTKKLDRKTRKRKANQNSRLSKSERKRVARKAARTRKKDVSGTRKAQVKRKKALKKRASRGIKDNR